jgi:hypothetical protein
MPVSWKILTANVEHPWKPEWIELLDGFRRLLPATWTVIVLTDRGLYGRWLFRAIVALGWHPLMRVTHTGKFRTAGAKVSRPFSALVPEPGRGWQGRGLAFPKKPQRRLECTLLACWEPGQKGPWFVLTDLAPEHGEVLWYGMRGWIENGFRLLKSEGWQWQRSRMSDPERADRLWLVLAVATRHVLALGGEAEDGRIVVETIPELLPAVAEGAAAARPTSSGRGRARRRRRVVRGSVEPARRRRRGARPEPAGGQTPVRSSGTRRRIVSIFQQGLAQTRLSDFYRSR